MTRIKILGETGKTVTLRRSDFQALLQAAEDTADIASVERHRAEEKRLGWNVAKRNYLTREETERILNGESPVRVWREKRGMAQRALADASRISASYLAEIEAGKKPGSHAALHGIAQILEVPMDQLGENPAPSLAPVTRSEKAAERLARLAEESGDRDLLADETRAVVREWLEIADREGVRHQVKAAIGTLESIITSLSADWAERSIQQDRIRDTGAARRMKRISDALEAAIDVLRDEYRKV
jgi:transcriptional regulator with XRE-family HTH domain